MNQYLTRHQYSNTFTEDLWKSLYEASGKPVDNIMTTWTKQMGFPVLKVSHSWLTCLFALDAFAVGCTKLIHFMKQHDVHLSFAVLLLFCVDLSLYLIDIVELC